MSGCGWAGAPARAGVMASPNGARSRPAVDRRRRDLARRSPAISPPRCDIRASCSARSPSSMPANDPLDPARERLVRDLAAQAGPVLAQRAVDRGAPRFPPAAWSRPRTRATTLERNIHDGAQQQLVALSVKTRLADSMIDRDPAKAHEMLAPDPSGHERCAGDPARPRARDLSAAAGGQGTGGGARGAGTQGSAPGDAGRRRHRTLSRRRRGHRVLLRAGGHAERREVRAGVGDRASAANVQRLADTSRFATTGVGFDPHRHTPGTGIQGMQDRLDAVGGSLRVSSAPGSGTVVTGRAASERDAGSRSVV